jgi:ribosomal protein S18 acetylase RimI-like enzyme
VIDSALFARLERFYDAVPRDSAVAEEFGSLVLFVRAGAGWPYYARPRFGAAEPPSAADITAAQARQRDLAVPEAFEWVHETTPDLLAVARSAGLEVLLAPLMVLDPAALPAPGDLPVRLPDPADPGFDADIRARRAVAQVAFAADAAVTSGPVLLGPGAGAPFAVAGAAERDAVPPATAEEIAEERRRTATGRIVSAVAETPADGVVSSGVLQRVDDVAEIAGVATLPAFRRRGFGAAVTAALARHALAVGVETVLLSAASDDIARTYAKLGFRRVGTACIAEPMASLE